MGKYKGYDFCGYATKSNIPCSDGLTIGANAFADNDGKKVPLVWGHIHNDPDMVLGHAYLERKGNDMFAYCYFNSTQKGQNAKNMLQHGDVESLSIWANQLKKDRNTVVHGNIRELSLVLAGANPGAKIEQVIAHSDTDSFEAIIHTCDDIFLSHTDDESEENIEENEDMDTENRTPEDIIDTLNEEQLALFYAIAGMNDDTDDDYDDDNGQENDNDIDDSEYDDEGDDEMKHNIFDTDEGTQNVLSHDAMQAIIDDAKRNGSLKDSVLAHSDEYGIEHIEYLFPEAKSLNTPPEFIKRETSWVQTLMGAVHHTPFSRIKSQFANITEDEARAKGYIKGNRKKEEVFTLLKRVTTPTTIYKKQKLDRDDIVDITDFDVVAWIKSEMRMMLDEEIARAVLVGDGRLSSSDDKINETNIRPVWTDDDLYTIKTAVVYAANDDENARAKKFIRGVIKSRKLYKGSGNPTLYTTEDVLTDCLLIEDLNGRVIYDNVEKLATALRVSKIVTVPVMDNLTRSVTKGSKAYTHTLLGLILNPVDYNIGADKGGSINMFDDFDIDYNQYKYLIETRCSGALTKPYSAMAVEAVAEVTTPAGDDDQNPAG